MSSGSIEERFPALATSPPALAWLSMRADLGLAPRTIDAYARGLSEYLTFCTEALSSRWKPGASTSPASSAI